MGMADKIKERRIAMGLTQEELGQKLGVQKSAIAKYENGRVKNIKRSVILKMAEILQDGICGAASGGRQPASADDDSSELAQDRQEGSDRAVGRQRL